MNKLVELLTGAKVHANHTAIKGKKSGGKRDSNGNDWRLLNTPPGEDPTQDIY